MLTMNDCIDMSGLAAEVISAIAEHEHIPDIVALEMGCSMCQTSDGECTIRSMIVDDIVSSRQRGDFVHACELENVLSLFVQTHPAVQ